MGGLNLQLVVIFLFFGITALSWIVNKLREQAEVKRLRDEMRRREEESLRSTNVIRQDDADRRVAEGVKSPTQQRMEELAARRQAQLRELRERQSGEAAQQRRTSPGGVMMPAPGTTVRPPGGRIPTGGPMRGPAGGPPTAPTPMPMRVPTGTPRQPGGLQRQPTGQQSGQPTGQPSRQPSGRQAAATQRDRQNAELRSAPPIRERERVILRPLDPSPAVSAIAAFPIEASAIGARTASGYQAIDFASPVARDVRGLLAIGEPERRRRQRALLAAAEVLNSPISLRDSSDLPWNRASM